jgi:prolipoprotein diacylglyceryltransferase
MAVVIFAFLWAMRKRWKVPGTLFSVYLMFNGMERFWIEKIRVNAPMEFMGKVMTQAELIASLTFISGLVLLLLVNKKSLLQRLGR